MINDNSAPSIKNEKFLAKPFGQRFFDYYVRVHKTPKKPLLCIFISLMTVLIIILWMKIPKKLLINSVTSISFTLKSFDKSIMVPPLILKIKFDSSQQKASYKSTKINVVSFSGDGKIPPGAEARAVLLTGATNGMIKAKLMENLKIDGMSLLDAGTLLIGEGQSSEERLFIRFNKAVFKNGKFFKISAQGYDLSDKILGLKGSRVGDYTLKLAASSGLYFLSGFASGFQNSESGQIPNQVRKPSVSDAALQGVSTASQEQAKQYLEQIKNRGPLIEVKSGTEFILNFDDMGGEL